MRIIVSNIITTVFENLSRFGSDILTLLTLTHQTDSSPKLRCRAHAPPMHAPARTAQATQRAHKTCP